MISSTVLHNGCFNTYPDVPDAPSFIKVQEVVGPDVTIQWGVPESDGGLPLTSYYIERRDMTLVTTCLHLTVHRAGPHIWEDIEGSGLMYYL